MGKEKIINYCNQFSQSSIEHIENAIENKGLIEQGKYRELHGCPSSYGLDEYIGLCEIEETDNYTNKQKEDMCEECWKKALDVL